MTKIVFPENLARAVAKMKKSLGGSGDSDTSIKEVFHEVFALWKEEILSMLPTGSDTQGYTTLHETLKLLDSAALEQLEERLLVLFEQASCSFRMTGELRRLPERWQRGGCFHDYESIDPGAKVGVGE